MKTVTSTDGTLIAYEQSGSGPPLILIHAAGLDHNFWDISGVRSALAKQTTVYAVDRRGYGESKEAGEYSLDQEVEDMAAVINSINEPVTLLGHSTGAIVALEASVRIDNLHGLILYEPFTLEEGLPFLQQAVEEYRSDLAGGNNEHTLISDMQRMGMPEAATKELRSHPSWPAIVNTVGNMDREYQQLLDYRFDKNHFKSMTTPTLLLFGGEEPPPLIAATELMHETFPNSQMHVFDGQEHWAMNTATDEFISTVLDFIHELG